MWGRVRLLVLTELGAAKLGYYVVFTVVPKLSRRMVGLVPQFKSLLLNENRQANMNRPDSFTYKSKLWFSTKNCVQ